jgi:beta-glucosidase
VALKVLQQVAKLLVCRGARLCAQKWLNMTATCYNIPQLEADEYEWTQHYANWEGDLLLAREDLGLRYLRYTVPWYKVNPAPHSYDWEWTDRVIEKATALDLDLILNPIQFGTPEWLKNGFGNPDFPEYATEYFGQLADRYSDTVKFYTPHNEPLITALFCGDLGNWPHYWRGLVNYVKFLELICRQIILSVKAVKTKIPHAVMIHVDAGEYYATRQNNPNLLAEVERRNQRRFICYDLISGRVNSDHPLFGWLIRHGMSEKSLNWFQENAIELDVVGIDFYPHCLAWLELAKGELIQHRDHGYNITQAFAKSRDSSQVQKQINLPSSLAGFLKQYYERYQRPLMLTETDYCGLDHHKMLYLEYSVQEIRRLRAEGVPVLGYSWWPLLDHLNWDKALKERGHIHLGQLQEKGLKQKF